MDNHVIHIHDALNMLESGKRCTVKVWKLSTGDVLTYRDVICVGKHKLGATHRVELPDSSVIREFRDITLFEINGLKIYR